MKARRSGPGNGRFRWQVVVAKFVPHTHKHSPCAAGTFAGDGDIGKARLAKIELTEQAVTDLGRLLVAAGAK